LKKALQNLPCKAFHFYGLTANFLTATGLEFTEAFTM
jgi:hypothetical protein